MFRSRPRHEDIFRAAARRRFRAELERVREEKQKTGRFPYEGAWRSLDEIAALREEMRRQDRRIFFEILVLFGVMAAIVAFIGVLTKLILPW